MEKRGLTLEQMIYARKNHNKKTIGEISKHLGVSIDRIKWFCRGYISKFRGSPVTCAKKEKKDLVGRFVFLMNEVELSFGKPKNKIYRPRKKRKKIKTPDFTKLKSFIADKEIDYDKLRQHILKNECNYYDLPINDTLKTERPKAIYTQSRSPYGIANELHGVKII